MSQKREKGYSQKGRSSAQNVKQTIAAEELDQATHPTKNQNSKQ